MTVKMTEMSNAMMDIKSKNLDLKQQVEDKKTEMRKLNQFNRDLETKNKD